MNTPKRQLSPHAPSNCHHTSLDRIRIGRTIVYLSSRYSTLTWISIRTYELNIPISNICLLSNFRTRRSRRTAY